MSTLNETPSANRLHIGIFGKTNSGKSSFINAFTGQQVSIVSDVSGTTTDPVNKVMEIHPLGPCVLIDTAGFDDETSLGLARQEKTVSSADKCDIAIVLVSAESTVNELASDASEYKWIRRFQEKKVPLLILINKTDLQPQKAIELKGKIQQELIGNLKMKEDAFLIRCISALTGEGIVDVKNDLTRLLPEDFGIRSLTGTLCGENDSVLLVMPQDIQAPKGRLILPQVQTIRELLDKKCLVHVITTDKLIPMLDSLKNPPKLIITDSQVFDYCYQNKPKESMLTSFSVLMAGLKGDLPYYIESAKAIDSLTENSRVLIAECCTHAPLEEDIGRVKIPRMLRKRFGEGLTVDLCAGTDFPEDPSQYDLIIQCGACMFNRQYVLARIEKARAKEVPMTNYGVIIAHLTGILDKISVINGDGSD